MDQLPKRLRAASVLAGMVLFTFALAIIPNAIPALDALGRFVNRPAVGTLVLFAAGAGPAGVQYILRVRRRTT
jgi:hypothetical protein